MTTHPRKTLEDLGEFIDLALTSGRYAEKQLEHFRKTKQAVEELLAHSDDVLKRICGSSAPSRVPCREALAKYLLEGYATFDDEFKNFLATYNKFDRVGGYYPPDLGHADFVRGKLKTESYPAGNNQAIVDLKEYIGELIQKYEREGVHVKDSGFNDFEDLSLLEVDFNNHSNGYVLEGSRRKDFIEANKMEESYFEPYMNFPKDSNGHHILDEETRARKVQKFLNEIGLTWHHNEDLHTMQLVPSPYVRLVVGSVETN